jgi:MOSC domain-containing protein YiiM
LSNAKNINYNSLRGGDFMGKVLRINISAERGVIKQPVEKVEIVENWGVKGDGHGGDWDKQISIFPIEALSRVPEDMKEEVNAGGYTENFTVEGLELEAFAVGAKVKIGEAVVEVCHIGKEVYKEHDRHYIVSREGRFGKVVRGGSVRVGDDIEIISL